MDLLRQRAGALRPRWWTRSAWGIAIVVALVVGVFGLLELDVVLASPVDAIVQSCGTDVVDGGIRSPDIVYTRCALLVHDRGATTEESAPLSVAEPAGTHVPLVRTTASGLQDLRLDDGGGWPALPIAVALLAAVWWMGYPTPVAAPGRHARRARGDRYRDERASAHPGDVESAPDEHDVRRLQALLRGEVSRTSDVSEQRSRSFRRNTPWIGVVATALGGIGALTDPGDGVPWFALVLLGSGLVLLALELVQRRRTPTTTRSDEPRE